MKKLLGILVLGLIFFATSADSLTKTKKTKFKKGQIYEGTVVYKVKSNQISNSEAKNRLTAYEQQKINARRQNARQIGEVSDGLNCLLFGVACN